MIEDPPLLKIRRNFPRPDSKHVKTLQNVSTGFLADCMHGRGALDHHIKPLDLTNCRMTGTVITCQCGPDDNLGLFAALHFAQPGDILVAGTNGFTQSAVSGDIMLGMARNKGVIGFVTDGMVRDIEGILVVGLPVFSRGVTPNSCVRNGPGSVGLAVAMAGVSIESGDVMVGDRDGVVVIPRNELDDVCRKLLDVKEAEANLTRRVRLGLDGLETLDELLGSDRTQFLD